MFIDFARALQADRYESDLLTKEAKIETQHKAIEEIQSQVGAASTNKFAEETELARLQELLADDRSTNRTLQQEYQSLQLLVAQAKDKVTIVEAPRVEPSGTPDSYTASVTLLVDQVGGNAQTDYTGILASERLAGTYAQMMTGRSVLEAAVAKLGTGQSPDALAAAVKAEPIAGTQLMRLQVTGADSEATVDLADAIAQAFIEQMGVVLEKPYAGRLAALQAEITRVSESIEEVQKEIQVRSAAYRQSGSELTRLEDELAESRSQYRTLQQDYEQVRLTASQAPGTVVITERAVEPQRPARSKMQYVFLAGMMAMMATLGGVFLVENLDDSIRAPEDVSHALGLGTLGMIDQFESEQDKPVVASQPQSSSAEAFRVLATNIRLSSMDSRLRTIVVTSPAPSDGKTVVTANLAVAMAGAGLHVVVVDADLRRPRLHELFGLSQGQGLTDALWQGNTVRYLKPTGVEGVRILTSGKVPLDPVGVVSSPRMKKFLDDLAQEADLVIIDSPPVLAVADTTILAAGVDGVLMVLKAGHTGRQTARRAVEALQQARTRLLGVVLNGVPFQGDRYYRYYGTTDETASPGSRSGRRLFCSLGVCHTKAISGVPTILKALRPFSRTRS